MWQKVIISASLLEGHHLIGEECQNQNRHRLPVSR